MEVFKLKKPDISGQADALVKFLKKGTDISPYIKATATPEYLFWDKVRYKSHPPEITAEIFWFIVKLFREQNPNRVKTIIRDVEKNYFSWQPLPGIEYFLHKVDMQLGGFLESVKVDYQTIRQRFISRGIMEEAIASSQLEGANTTRKVAKRMIVEKRKPSNRSEKMILNNYKAMLYIESTLKNQKLTLDLLLDLHIKITEGTIEDEKVGALRKEGDNIVVSDQRTGIIYHAPPPVKFINTELKRFIKYANDDIDKSQFVHPFIKSVFLHFWIGYLHPFTDGNGRLARAIFYWYLLKEGFWAFTYLPISKVIKNSPAQYRDAYVYSEQDGNDLTYFLDYNIRKVSHAIREFENYVKRKQIENRKMTKIAKNNYNLNNRQIQVLRHLYKNSDSSFTIKTYSHIYDVSRMTARKDLIELEELGFLSSKKRGRERPFTATEKVSKMF